LAVKAEEGAFMQQTPKKRPTNTQPVIPDTAEAVPAPEKPILDNNPGTAPATAAKKKLKLSKKLKPKPKKLKRGCRRQRHHMRRR
jgi:hypothetical protein